METTKVVVIGGDLDALVAANWLARAGCNVSVAIRNIPIVQSADLHIAEQKIRSGRKDFVPILPFLRSKRGRGFFHSGVRS